MAHPLPLNVQYRHFTRAGGTLGREVVLRSSDDKIQVHTGNRGRRHQVVCLGALPFRDGESREGLLEPQQ